MFAWSSIRDHFKQMRPFMAFGFILFFAGLIVGATNGSVHDYLNGQLEALQRLSNNLKGTSNPTLAFMLFIFLNNAIKAIFVMYLGALFGFIPAFFLVVNGMVVGYLLYMTHVTQGVGAMMDTVVRGLLPHGIIEIPAIVVASAYGLKFGTLIWKGGFSLVGGKRGIGKEIEQFVRRTVPVMIILVIALLVASVIESTVTVWLMSL